MEKKAKNGQILSIVQWVILLGIGIGVGSFFWWGWMFPLAMFLIHTSEFFLYGKARGAENGYTALESLCLTWLYGFTWWKYLPTKDDAPAEDENKESDLD